MRVNTKHTSEGEGQGSRERVRVSGQRSRDEEKEEVRLDSVKINVKEEGVKRW